MCWPTPNSKPEFCHHVHCRMTGSTYGSASPPSLAAMLRAKPARTRSGPASPSSPATVSVRWIHCRTTPNDSTGDAAIDATPTSEPFIGRRLPNRMMTTKAMPGMSGISQAFSRNQPLEAASISYCLPTVRPTL